MLLEKRPLYQIEKSYDENLTQGPCFEGDLPQRVWREEKEWINFLGFQIASPLGVPAGPLLSSEWVALAAKLGFDVLTYKTIRSRAFPAHPLPNMLYVKANAQLLKEGKEALFATKKAPKGAFFGVTNSFGMPSQDPTFLIQDIAKAKASLQKGQVMIVSVVGTAEKGTDFAKDFVAASRIALEGGADLIEANFSCPNVSQAEGSLYQDPEALFEIASKMKAFLGSVPLILKMGVFTSLEKQRKALLAAARAGALAICGINTLSYEVVKDDQTPALGEGRKRAGICGAPILEAALHFLESSRQIIDEERLDLELIGTGGVCAPHHFDTLLEKGASVAMSAAGMMWNPYLAAQYHKGE